MISEWYTHNDLAGMKLSGLPSSQQGLYVRAKRENWLSRQRIGIGGGYEYHISSLPDVARAELIERLSSDSINNARARQDILPMPPAADAVSDTVDKGIARIAIVNGFKTFLGTRFGVPVLTAESEFMFHYAAARETKNSAFVPGWVFDAYPDFSIQSLRRWRALREKDLQALEGARGSRKGSGVIDRAEDGELKRFIVAVMLKQPHLTGGHVRDMCRAQFGETVSFKTALGTTEEKELPHVRTFVRFISDWKRENAYTYERLTNPDGHKNKFQVAVGRADAGIERLNQLWEIDASPADVLCEDGRYALYGIIDVWSRRTMYMVTKTPRTEAALLLIRRAVMEWGVPETIRTDNGSDFTSRQFMSALISLGIAQDICPPFSGDKKPFIERSFHTLQHDLMPFLPGYIGHSVKDRKEIESRRAFAQRIGESADKAFAVELTHHKLQEMIDRWVTDRYMHRTHKGLPDSVTPFIRVTGWTSSVKRIENARAMDLLLAPVAGNGGYRTIGKKGIRLDGGHFMDGGLIPYVGRRVFIRCNPEDMGVIYCFDEDGTFISEAKCTEREGVNPVAYASAMKAAQRAYEKEFIDPIRRDMRKLKIGKMAEDFLALAAKDNGSVTALPHASVPHMTDGLSEAAKAVASTSGDRTLPPDYFANKAKKETPVSLHQSDEERWWNRAKELEARIDQNEVLEPEEAKWLGSIQKAPWYIARTELEQMRANPAQRSPEFDV